MAIDPRDQALIDAGLPRLHENPAVEPIQNYTGNPLFDTPLNTHRQVANTDYARMLEAAQGQRAERLEGLRRNAWRVGGTALLLGAVAMGYGVATGTTPVEVVNKVGDVLKDGWNFIKDRFTDVKKELEPDRGKLGGGLFDIGDRQVGGKDVEGGPVYNGLKNLFTTIGMENPTQAAQDGARVIATPPITLLGRGDLARDTEYDAAGSWGPIAALAAIPAAGYAGYRALAPVVRGVRNTLFPNSAVGPLRRYENRELNQAYNAAVAAGNAPLMADINVTRAHQNDRQDYIRRNIATLV